MTFEYGSVAQSYTQQTATSGARAGTVFAAGWNQVTNMACSYGACETPMP